MARALLSGLTLRALVAGAAWLAHGPAAFLSPDSASYLSLASSLVSHSTFANQLGQPEVFRTPGYPMVLAVGVLLGHPVLFAVLANLLLTGVLIALCHSTAREISGRADVASWCALALAVEPTVLLWSLKVMPETLFTVGLLWFVASVLRHLRSPAARWSLASASGLVTAAYVRPIAYPLALLANLAALGWMLALSGWRLRCHALLFLALSAGGLGAWHLRNSVRAGYSGFSTLTIRSVYISAGGSVAARRDGVPYYQVRQRRREDLAGFDSGPAADRGPGYERLWREGWTQVASDPVTYGLVHLAGVSRTLVDPGAIDYFRLFGRYGASSGLLGDVVDRGATPALVALRRRSPGVFWSSIGLAFLTLPYVAVSLSAAWRACARARRPFFVLAALLAYLTIVSGGVAGSSRFRAPMVPLFVLVIACASRPLPALPERLASGTLRGA